MLHDEHSEAWFHYLSRDDVVVAAAEVDILGTVRQALIDYSMGLGRLPQEGYLGWQTPTGFSARSIAMQGAIPGRSGYAYGLKMINGSLGNVERGLPRSQGFTVLFDPESARPLVVMEAAYISSMRTAAVTMATAMATGGPQYTSLALIGCGTLAKAHVILAERYLRGLKEVSVYDVSAERAQAFVTAAANLFDGRVRVWAAGNARECVQSADIVVPVTTVTDGYIEPDWIRAGALIAHVSLDDLLPAVVERADVLLVDDWNLVADDHRRLFGRMHREGLLLSPTGERWPGSRVTDRARLVDGTLGELFLGTCRGRSTGTEVIVSNPFGMAILDVAVATGVYEIALHRGRGTRLPV
jgi:ornithine cyclodeaminase